GMCRLRAHLAEVIRRGDEALGEMPLPQTIGHRPPGERVVAVRDPFRQGDAAGRLVLAAVQVKLGRYRRDAFESARCGVAEGIADIAAAEDLDLARPLRRLEVAIRREVAGD